MKSKIIKQNSVHHRLIHNISKYKRINDFYPIYLSITLEDLAKLREELGLEIEKDLNTFKGIKLKILHEETC